MVGGRDRLPLGHPGRGTRLIHGDEDDDAVGGLVALPVGRVAAVDIHRQVHAGGAGVDHLGVHLHQLAYLDGTQEADAPHVDGDRIAAAPAGGAGVAGLIDPLHHHAAVHLAAEVHVGGLGQKLQGQLAGWGHALSSAHCRTLLR
ncbi:hypothetical protein D3C76_1450950 [compost metagenome]